jgi:hypothetical protein
MIYWKLSYFSYFFESAQQQYMVHVRVHNGVARCNYQLDWSKLYLKSLNFTLEMFEGDKRSEESRVEKREKLKRTILLK